MPVPRLSLAEALAKLQSLGRVRIVVANSAATAQLEGQLAFDDKADTLLLRVGCACTVQVARERVRHVVLSEKEADGKPAAHAQLFDGNYDKVVAFVFPDGIEPARKLVAQLDGNDFEIG